MGRTFKYTIFKNARLYITYGLVFFLLFAISGCKHRDPKIELIWKNGNAVGLSIPKNLIHNFSSLRFARSIHILLSGKKPTYQDIIGDFDTDDDNLLFTPAIPFTSGLTYDIFQDDKLLGSVKVPADTSAAPRLLTIYPETDTLPENTLKLYLKFSKPMRTGASLNYITLLDKNKDTMRRVFLDLQPELWDTSGTVLTLWLDPGRIKRGLVLNRELGNPLKKAESYQLVISNLWKDTHGIALAKSFTKQFVTGERSTAIIDIKRWQLISPKANTLQPLVINTGRSLDHYLLQESIAVIGSDGKSIEGVVALSNKDKTWSFMPAASWQQQAYKIRVAAKLEDLAGNNLNRVFDRDLMKDKQTNVEFVERTFKVTSR